MKAMNLKNILISQLIFLGLGALAGGGSLIISPSGKLIGMPLKLLAHSPFADFFLPAIILFVVFGIIPMLLAFVMMKNRQSRLAENLNLFKSLHWTRSFAIYLAIALIIWIQLEMQFLNAISWLHTFYVCYGLAMIVVALMPGVSDKYTNRNVLFKHYCDIITTVNDLPNRKGHHTAKIHARYKTLIPPIGGVNR